MQKIDIKEQIVKVIAKINEKNPYYTVGLFLLVLFLADYFLVMQFQLRTLQSLSPKIMTTAKDLETAKSDITKIAQYQNQAKQLKEKLKKISNKIKSREEVPLILGNISKVAESNGVRIEQIMPNTARTEPILKNSDGQYFSVPISIEAKAAYHNLGRFINQLEIEEGFLSVPDFVISASTDDPTREDIKLTINAIIFEKTQK